MSQTDPARFRVRIEGSGVAAHCCAKLLRNAGLAVSMAPVPRPAVPAILVSGAALALIRDVFGRADLLASARPVRQRIVRWGEEKAVALPHAAVTLGEAALIEALAAGEPDHVAGPPHLTIHTAAPHAPSLLRRFGERRGSTVEVRLRDPSDGDACRIEAREGGWLFLVPGRDGHSWLLGVGAPLDELLAGSRLIGPAIVAPEGPFQSFDTAARLAPVPAAPGRLVAGTAAIAFDPICGDGAAQAVRGAILAAAVATALAEGGDPAALRGHYAAMLTAAMRRHLALSLDFYARGEGPWWMAQAEALREGHRWCTARLAATPPPAFRLEGARLVPVAVAA